MPELRVLEPFLHPTGEHAPCTDARMPRVYFVAAVYCPVQFTEGKNSKHHRVMWLNKAVILDPQQPYAVPKCGSFYLKFELFSPRILKIKEVRRHGRRGVGRNAVPPSYCFFLFSVMPLWSSDGAEARCVGRAVSARPRGEFCLYKRKIIC